MAVEALLYWIGMAALHSRLTLVALRHDERR